MFRKDNKDHTDRSFNTLIKQNKLNNSLAKYTKIVYISNNKIPKPLLLSDWKPSAVLMYGSKRTNMKLDSYINECDLIIHYDSDSTPFGYQDIEEI